MSNLYRMLWVGAAAACAFAAGSNAYADVYSYTESGSPVARSASFHARTWW